MSRRKRRVEEKKLTAAHTNVTIDLGCNYYTMGSFVFALFMAPLYSAAVFTRLESLRGFI